MVIGQVTLYNLYIFKGDNAVESIVARFNNAIRTEWKASGVQWDTPAMLELESLDCTSFCAFDDLDYCSEYKLWWAPSFWEKLTTALFILHTQLGDEIESVQAAK